MRNNMMHKMNIGVVNIIQSKYMDDKAAAFGMTEEEDQVFISPSVMHDYTPQIGDTLEAIVVLNTPELRDRTKWKAISVRYIQGFDTSIENIVSIKREPTLEEQILDILNDYVDDHGATLPMTSRQICEELGSRGVDTVIRQELEKLHKTGKVVKADIYAKEKQQRVSLTLWALSLDAFTYGMEEEEVHEAMEVHG